ncbi:Deoxynucleotidyltransferase terminal-interacting protein 2 [Vanrija pseudolonga]|uniref:Deoxynucleotidyltransferase terminal-interacting protein 2 n=1 Tax=Vanrija pseudolonga TaxID=143232 RepID=A0AAF0Y4W2_9TREE|nr:Deoxynucleotidyltransferase terminal-interacting protein 2 [Vanrija pseudolonga]
MSTPRRTPRRSLAASSPVVLLPAPATPTHYTKADLLARAEASQLLGSEDEDGLSSFMSPRARRHAAFTRAREASAEPSVSGTPVARSSAPKAATISESPEPPTGGEDAGEASGSEGPNSPSDSTSTSSASDSSSDDDSSSEDDDDDESDSDDDDSDDEEEELERQLAAARASATAAVKKGKSSAAAPSTALGEDEDGELKFESEEPKEAPIPDLAIPSISTRHLVLADDGTARAGEAGPSKLREGAPELDRRGYERALSKREKLAPKKATASELWTTLPSARQDELPQMKRDYQALALANSLDPKRFMKGGNRGGKVPEKFAIGTMVQAPRHLQDTTVQKERKYRAGEIVASLIQDANIGSYAKRKYEDLQGKRMANGRGKGWHKRSKTVGFT